MTQLFITFLFLIFSANEPIEVDIQHLPTHDVLIECMGNEKSTHYNRPIILTLYNREKRDVLVKIPMGSIFNAADSSVQDMIITRDEEILVKAGDQNSIALSAMCIEPQNRAPSGLHQYAYSGTHDELLYQTVSFLNKNHFKGATAQQAIWTVIQKPDQIELNGWNIDEINRTGAFLAELLGLPVPEEVVQGSPQLYDSPPRRAVVRANFSYYFPDETNVVVALFDMDGILQRELYQRMNAKPGEYQISMSFDGTPYIGQEYEFKLIADGEVQLTRPLDLR